MLKEFNIYEEGLKGDHLGLQVLSADEFNQAHELISRFSTLINAGEIHNRRNNIYRFNEPVMSQGISVRGVEIFEPKPNANLRALKPGIEHLAFMVDDFDSYYEQCLNKGVPIDKMLTFDSGSKFFKTKLVNMVEVEFRNDFLGDRL